MADEEQPDQTQAHEPRAEVGIWLREAREAKSLTADAVADALHLDIAIVEALENEAFESLGATVFAKGHLRAVANHLGLDEKEAARRFEQVSGIHSGELPELIVQYNKPLQSKPRWPLFVGLAVAVLIVATGLAYALIQWRMDSGVEQTPASVPAAEPAVEVIAPGNSVASAQPVNNAAVQATPGSSFADKLAVAGTAADTAVANTEPLAPSPTRRATPTTVATATGLTLTFSDECWFEVRDADGRRLAYGTAQAGTERQIRGTRPLSVTLGVADAVAVRVDGQVLAMNPSMIRGRAARFTVQ